MHDRALIDCCLSGEASAWTTLYQRFHNPLLVAIRALLRDTAADYNLVDEIAARVWYAVIRDDGRLLSRFDTSKGCRLSTFLSVIARSEARQYFRSERRRSAREQFASRDEVQGNSSEMLMSATTEEEFLATLTPSERAYFTTALSPSPESPEPTYSTENAWQLSHRVKKKLHQFLSDS